MARPAVDELLKDYLKKRDFSKTAEPDHAPEPRKSKDALSFVVQKHDATRLHYDFRLEWNGVLKSWAVTRGPSYDPSEKRLAVRTEDHPLAYGGFEGVIPEDQYGGGAVMLWDRGTWAPVEDFEAGLKQGKLVFRLEGERLKGEWTLVRMKPKPGEKRENWLLIKHREAGFKPPRGDVLKRHVKSVASDRTMAQIANKGRTLAKSDLSDRVAPQAVSSGGGSTGKKAARKAARTRSAAMPRWRSPQLATLVDDPPSGSEWLSEMKYDGYRALIAIAGGKARVFTRNNQDWTDRFPAIVDAAERLDTDGTLIDGEIVAFDRNGKADFSSLQRVLSTGGRDLSCFCFDLIVHNGEDISRLPLVKRKARLETMLGEGSAPLVYSAHVKGSAGKVFEQICSAGHEGIVAKRADDPYRSGRGRSWLKVKCTRRQEFVIGGFSPTDKRNRPFSSVLIGTHENGGLVYRGRVGSFEAGTLDELAPLVAKRVRKISPFTDLPGQIGRSAKFVRPDLVAEIDFTEFTAGGVVRHGVFKGLRGDKKAEEVVLETAGEKKMASHEERDTFAGVRLSSPDKPLFEEGVTKADIAAHYERVAGRMMPQARNRLLSLVRCPDGANGQCFFQKHGHKGFREDLKRMEIAEADGKKDEYLYADSLAGLIAAVQMSTLEFHIWGSRIDRLEQPDRLVFDLDPDEGLGFADVRDAAFDIRDRLKTIGLDTIALLTGGKGIHVIAPLERRAEWPVVKAFTRGFARLLAEDEPERYVAQAAKAKREGRIFVDWLRNERGSTAIAPWSTRARKGAPVATPVSWDELKRIEAANAFRIGDMDKRLAMTDPWADSANWRQSITKRLLSLVGEA